MLLRCESCEFLLLLRGLVRCFAYAYCSACAPLHFFHFYSLLLLQDTILKNVQLQKDLEMMCSLKEEAEAEQAKALKLLQQQQEDNDGGEMMNGGKDEVDNAGEG